MQHGYIRKVGSSLPQSKELDIHGAKTPYRQNLLVFLFSFVRFTFIKGWKSRVVAMAITTSISYPYYETLCQVERSPLKIFSFPQENHNARGSKTDGPSSMFGSQQCTNHQMVPGDGIKL